MTRWLGVHKHSDNNNSSVVYAINSWADKREKQGSEGSGVAAGGKWEKWEKIWQHCKIFSNRNRLCKKVGATISLRTHQTSCHLLIRIPWVQLSLVIDCISLWQNSMHCSCHISQTSSFTTCPKLLVFSVLCPVVFIMSYYCVLKDMPLYL